jgi:HSP20 family protein
MLARPPATFAAETRNEDRTFKQKMEEWQEKMSQTFSDAWKSLRHDNKSKSIATASVDLREQRDSYTLRFNLPDRDLEKVEIKLENSFLHIVGPAGDRFGRYEQTIKLDGVSSEAEPKIERRQKDAMIVVTVPKSVAVTRGDPVLPDPSLFPLSDWDRNFMLRMEAMRRDMDRAFSEAFDEFKLAPDYKGFFDEPRFGSAIDLKDEGGNYIVRAYLPERTMTNVNVTVANRSLKIEAKEQESESNKDQVERLHSERKAAYSQILTLPGPVQADKMKVEKKEAMLVVTLPKAKE